MAIEVGSKLEGKVTGITNFGAFIELEPGVTGLVHISEIADNYVKDIKDILKIADVVTVKVINIEKDGKIGLSIKQAVDKPKEEQRPERFERGDRPPRGDRGPRGDHRGGRGDRNEHRMKPTFDDKLSRFLKDSEDRLSTLRRQTDSKRGGRGARRG
jgi:S1 RNA binding domain protein